MTNALYDYLIGAAADRDTPFLPLPGGGTMTHATFARMAARYANALMTAGAQEGDWIALQVARSPDALGVVAACAQAGFVVLPLDPGYSAAQTAAFVSGGGARIFVTDPARVDEMVPASENAVLMTLGADGTGTLADFAAASTDVFATVPRAGDDPAALLHSSKANGVTSGVLRTQADLVAAAQALAEPWQVSPQEGALQDLPMFTKAL